MSNRTATTRPLRALAEVTLGRMRSPERAEGPNMVPYLRAANVKDGSLDLADVKSMDFNPSEQSTYALRSGDVLVTEGAGSLAAVGASAVWNGEIDGVVCFQNTLLRLRPRGDTEARYLMWWARHAYGSGLLASVAQGANIYHLGADNVRVLPASVPEPSVQRAIAEYLDVETARIDALVATRRGLIELLNERRSAVIADLTGGDLSNGQPAGRTRLKFAVGRPTSGNRDHSFTSDDSGIPCLRGLNIKPGWVDQANLMRISEADHRAHAATTLRADDVVIVRSGNAGTAAVVPRGLDGANCVDLVIIRQSTSVEPKYLEYILNSPQARMQAEMGVFGATLTHFNAVDIAELSLFIPSICEQRALVSKLVERTGRIDIATEAMHRQVGTLLERRQALITAAVTGRLDIPRVAA